MTANMKVSMQCRAWGQESHKPCPGRADVGIAVPCECWCHQLPAPVMTCITCGVELEFPLRMYCEQDNPNRSYYQ